MRRGICITAVAVCSLVGVRPSLAQLASSPWPKQFQGNENRARSSTTGPANTLSLVYTTGSLPNCSDPTFGADSTVYVTWSNSPRFGNPVSWLYAYTVSNNQLVL